MSAYGTDGALALAEAARVVGLSVNAEPRDGQADLVLVNPEGGEVAVEVKRVSLASIDGLSGRIKSWNDQLSGPSTVGVVVADRVTSEARTLLHSEGWGWLDLRGHLHLVTAGLFIDTDIPSMSRSPGRPAPLAGRVAVEVAVVLLLDPDKPVVVRQIAGTLERAPSSVSGVLSRMKDTNLVDNLSRPVLPELFWQLAARWQPSTADVAAVPSPAAGVINDALRLGLEDVHNTSGWALTDTLAAAAYGAPVGVRSDHPPDFYVPDEATLRRAGHLLGVARDHQSRAATIRVAPVRTICNDRVDAAGWANQVWPLAQPLFVALDLAQDPGRGREVLEGWTPHDFGRRVW